MTEPSRAVFLSYASQDAEAARRICEALRAGGIEVWFNQSELRDGDVWDQKIRRELHDCALFIPVISANTASRHEGYWNLADQRTQMMARDRAFIVPVCVDSMPDSGTDVPESFLRVQRTRLPAGETPPGFVVRVSQLVSPNDLWYELDFRAAAAKYSAARSADPTSPHPDWPRLFGGCVAGPCYSEFIAQLSRKIERDPLNAGTYSSPHDPSMVWAKVDPMLAPLRDNPRYQVVLHKLNLPE